MDLSITENEKVDLGYFKWLGFKNVNGALERNGLNGEVQFYDNDFWFCQNNKAVKKIVVQKDINDILFK